MSTPTIHDLLDDAAGRALDRDRAGVPDPAAALARAAGRRRDAVRRRARLLVAACVVTALALGGAWLAGWPHRSAQPATAGTPRGLPDRWWTPPLWAPYVTDEPIESAVLLLQTRVHPYGDDPGGDLVVTGGAVVVSADGRQYRRLPLPAGASSVTLSPSGRKVAWLQSTPDVPHLFADVVVLDLATGLRRTVTGVDGTAEPGALSWLPGDRGLAVTVLAGSTDDTANQGYRVDPAGRVAIQCRCGQDGVLVADPTGTLRTVGSIGDAPGADPLGVSRTAAPGSTDVAQRPVVISPDGRRTAYLPGLVTETEADDRSLDITSADGRTTTRRLPPGLAGATLLAWTPRGILAASRLDDAGRGALWLLDPTSAAAVVPAAPVARGQGPARVAGVAWDLAASGTVVRGTPPSTSHWSRAWVRDVLAKPGSHPNVSTALSLVLLLGGLVLLFVLSRATGQLVARLRRRSSG